MQVFDLDLWLPGMLAPLGREHVPSGPPGFHRLPAPEGYGFANYGSIFTRGKEDGGGAELPGPKSLDEWLSASDEVLEMMDSCSVARGVLTTVPNEAALAIANRHPERILALVSFSPHDGMRAVRRFESMVTQEGAAGLHVQALFDELPASDRRYYPFYAKSVELDVPVRIYTSMSYANDRPYDLGHPRHLDAVAVDFPELRIIAGLGGWPWVSDTVALVRRHPNLYLDTASHRPRYLGVAGSGWESLMRFGNTLIQDRVMIGLSWAGFGLSMQELIDEYAELPLKDAVREKWMFSNAQAFFGFDD
jgi:predicted TIM-barrel fold metal-dependent hydrolase